LKAAPFTYHSPKTVDEALRVFDEVEDPDDVKVLAGGQSLVPMLALRLAQPEHLLDINGLSLEWGQIVRAGDVLQVGALVRQRAAEWSREIEDACPLLAEALPMLAHPQIRNRGTLGGTIAHADPAAEFPTIAVALDATMVLIGRDGQRKVAADDFFQGFLTTAIEPGEILMRIDLPLMPERTGASFMEISRRHGDFAMVGVAATATLDGGVLADARLAFSGVAGTPVRARAAEELLRGVQPTAEAISAASAVAVEGLSPTADTHASASYRRHIARVLSEKALTTAIERARS
jgi:carbon-monoxide dehydrogenase medium subunit